MANRKSALPRHLGMEAGLRSATEAMQAAANAMMAATESFRHQVQESEAHSSRRTTRNKYHASRPSTAGSGSGPRPQESPREGGDVMSFHQLVSAFAEKDQADSRPDDYRRPSSQRSVASRASSYHSNHSAPPVPPAPQLAGFSPPRPITTRRATKPGERRPTTGSSASGETMVQTSTAMGPTPNWPIADDPSGRLASSLSATLDPHDDLNHLQGASGYRGSFFQAEEFDQRDFPLPPPRPEFLSRPRSTDSLVEPSPVMRIDRYTYVRPDSSGGFGASMLEQHQQQRQSRLRSHRKSRSLDFGAMTPLPLPSAPSYGFSLPREIGFVLIISLAQMLMLAGISQSLVPQNIIGKSFPDTQPGIMAWYSAAYGLTAGTFVLPSGKLGDVFGYKLIFIIGLIWFAVWELIGGFTMYIEPAVGVSAIFFIVCRAMMGIGPALIVPNGQAMLGRAYAPGRRKNIVMSLFGAAAPLGFIGGGAIASLFAEYVSWPWSFWAIAAICVALAGVSTLVLPPTENTSWTEEASTWKQLDAPGIILGVSGLVLLNFALNQAPIASWSTPYVYFLVIIGVMFLAAFAYVELHTSHPIIPISAMKPHINFVLLCLAAGWACLAIWAYYAFGFMENLRGYSPLLASAAMAQVPVLGLVASLLTGILLSHGVKPQYILFTSMVAFLAGSLLWATAPVGQSYWFNTFFGALVMPFGMDMSTPVASILLSNSVRREQQGIAASLVVTVVNYSIFLAVGIAGSVEMAVRNRGGDTLTGYRGAQYLGIGFGGLGILLAAVSLLQPRKSSREPELPAKTG